MNLDGVSKGDCWSLVDTCTLYSISHMNPAVYAQWTLSPMECLYLKKLWPTLNIIFNKFDVPYVLQRVWWHLPWEHTMTTKHALNKYNCKNDIRSVWILYLHRPHPSDLVFKSPEMCWHNKWSVCIQVFNYEYLCLLMWWDPTASNISEM